MKKILIKSINSNNNKDDLDDYIEVSNDYEGLEKLIIGAHIKYKFYSKIKSGGFLVMIKKSPIYSIKELNILVLKNKNLYLELPFFKYKFYQKSNIISKQSIFNSPNDRLSVINNGKNILNKLKNNIDINNTNNINDKINNIEDKINDILTN